MVETFPWECPYCNRTATISAHNVSINQHLVRVANKDGDLNIITRVVTCPNPECKEYQIRAELFRARWDGSKTVLASPPLAHWDLKPMSEAKVFPDYVPAAIRNDYEESCLIRRLSPKASATLARRCLQGMIRDFWSITRLRLIDEIKALEEQVDPLTWQAIDSVRKIGNIGAHMEKDINVIIEVEPEEAELLIGLVELLLKEWYINREERKKQLERIVALADEKSDAKKA